MLYSYGRSYVIFKGETREIFVDVRNVMVNQDIKELKMMNWTLEKFYIEQYVKVVKIMNYWYIDEKLGEEIANEYYQNEQRKIRKLVDNVLFKLKFIDIDPTDFYSLANEIFCDVLKRYDGNRDFDGFLYSCLMNKFKTEMTRRTRDKRCKKVKFKDVEDNKNAFIKTVIVKDDSLDRIISSPHNQINNQAEMTLGDTIADKFTIEKEFFEEREDGYSKKMLLYLSRLSEIQKEILRLTIAGYLPNEIREELHMTEKQYCDNYAAIHSYRNVSVLF